MKAMLQHVRQGHCEKAVDKLNDGQKLDAGGGLPKVLQDSKLVSAASKRISVYV